MKKFEIGNYYLVNGKVCVYNGFNRLGDYWFTNLDTEDTVIVWREDFHLYDIKEY